MIEKKEMKKYKLIYFLLVLFLVSLNSFAQIGSKIQKIENSFNPKYLYNKTVISSPAGLEYIIKNSKNSEAMVEYIKYQKNQKAIKLYALIPASISFITFVTNNRLERNQYIGMIGISGLISFYLNQKSLHHLNLSIEKYNSGFETENIGLNNLGLNLKYNF